MLYECTHNTHHHQRAKHMAASFTLSVPARPRCMSWGGGYKMWVPTTRMLCRSVYWLVVLYYICIHGLPYYEIYLLSECAFAFRWTELIYLGGRWCACFPGGVLYCGLLPASISIWNNTDGALREGPRGYKRVVGRCDTRFVQII